MVITIHATSTLQTGTIRLPYVLRFADGRDINFSIEKIPM